MQNDPRGAGASLDCDAAEQRHAVQTYSIRGKVGGRIRLAHPRFPYLAQDNGGRDLSQSLHQDLLNGFRLQCIRAGLRN